MTYKINKTDGSLLTEVIDSSIDTTATDLALIGKNVTGFGEYINENFVKLLENFASTSEPNNPITGQIWFDLSENRLKVYDGNGFRIGSGPIVSGTAPLNPIQGDLWIDSEENQLYFYDGTDRVLAGPIYKDSQGISGFEVDTIADTDGNFKVVVKLWAAQKLLGIFSKHEEFTPASPIPDFSGSIKTGFNASTLSGFKFHARATSADALVDGLGNIKPASSFMVTDGNNTTTGYIKIANPTPLTLGVGDDTSVNVNASAFQIESNVNEQDIKLTVRNSNTQYNGLIIKANHISNDTRGRVGIFNDSPQAMLHVGTPGVLDTLGNPTGNVIIEGNLTVKGNTTSVETTNLRVEDKQVELATITTSGTGTPVGNDAFIDQGGIVLRSTSLSGDKSLLWRDSTDSWTSNQNFDLSSISRTYKIGGIDVLTYDTLGTNVVNSSLTTLGTLKTLRVASPGAPTTWKIQIENGTISSPSGVDIVLSPGGTGRIDVANSVITGVALPGAASDAANKQYVDNASPQPWINVPDATAIPVITNEYLASNNNRLFIHTQSGPVYVTLPENPTEGDTVRFLDYDSEFDTNPLVVRRFRTPDLSTLLGTSSITLSPGVNTFGTTLSPLSTTSSGAGTGLTVVVTISEIGTTYDSSNTTITVVDQGIGYVSGETITISGADLGGNGSNDLQFDLLMYNILGTNSDLTVINQDSAFGLVYTDQIKGWKYIETATIPTTIYADLIGTVTGNIISTNTGLDVVDTSAVTTVFTGDLTGDVTGNLNGTASQADTVNSSVGLGTNTDYSVPYLLSTSGYQELTTDPNLLFNPSTNTLTADYFTANASFNGDLVGDVSNSSLTLSATSILTLETDTNAIIIKSGGSGVRISAFDNTGTQEQYAMQVTAGAAPGQRSTTLLYGDVQVVNTTTSNINGSSFKLPAYTNAELAARSLSFLNYGELIYNSSTYKIQAYVKDAVSPGVDGWVDLH